MRLAHIRRLLRTEALCKIPDTAQAPFRDDMKNDVADPDFAHGSLTRGHLARMKGLLFRFCPRAAQENCHAETAQGRSASALSLAMPGQ